MSAEPRELRAEIGAPGRTIVVRDEHDRAAPRWSLPSRIGPASGSSSAIRCVLPESDLAKIRKLREARVPPEAHGEVRIEVEQKRQAVNIVECRPPRREDFGPEWSRLPIARLRYVASQQLWTLYYHRHTGR